MSRSQRDQLTSPKQVVTAAVYARYSSEMQASTSARDQIERIKALAGHDQILPRMYPGAMVKIADEWIHCDEAASGKVAGRKGYQTILEGVRKKAFDLLLVDDLSRLTRSLGNMLELYQLLKHHDVELISISDRVSSADPNARTFFTVKGMVADFGNEAHSERTLRGLESRARELFSTGQKPYGYGSEATKTENRKGRDVKSHFRLFINQEQAPIVRRIFDLYAQGYGKKHIAKVLNQDGVPTYSRRPSGWNEGIIFNLLTNEKYIGRWVYRKRTWSMNPDTGKRVAKLLPRADWVVSTCEDLRIVSQEIWNKVQEQLRENKRTKGEGGTREQRIFGKKNRLSDRHLLSGVMSCADCGMGVVIVSGRNKGYYGCYSAHRQGTCGCKYLLPRLKVETAFVDFLHREVVENEEVISYATDCYNQAVREILRHAPDRRREIENEMGRLQCEIENLVRFIAEGKASDLETISIAIREREDRKSKLSQEISRLNLSQVTRPLATPYLVRDRISGFIGKIIDRGERFNEAIKSLLYAPMLVSASEDRIALRGHLNLGATLGGSIQCEMARPA